MIKDSKELYVEGLNIDELKSKLIPLEMAIGYKSPTNITAIDTYLSKQQKLEETLSYQELLESEKQATLVEPVVAVSNVAVVTETPIASESTIAGESTPSPPKDISTWGFVNNKIIGISPNQTAISSDLGNTWSINTHNMEMKGVRVCTFPSENVGYVGTSRKGLYKTIDRGKSWESINEPKSEYYTQNLVFIDENKGFISDGMNEIYSTSDGGNSWVQFKDNNLGNVTDIIAIDQQNIIIVSVSRLYVSTDGGSIWKPTASKGMKSLPRAGYFFNENRGIVVCEGYDIYKTVDGASSFTKPYGLGLGTSALLLDVDFMDESTGIAIGITGALVTYDGGETWADVKTPLKDLRQIHFIGDTVIIAAGKGILISYDKGKTYTQVVQLD